MTKMIIYTIEICRFLSMHANASQRKDKLISRS